MQMTTLMSPRETIEKLQPTTDDLGMKSLTVRHNTNEERGKVNILYNPQLHNRTRQSSIQMNDLPIKEEEIVPFSKSINPRSPYGNIALFAKDSKPSISKSLLRNQVSRPKQNKRLTSSQSPRNWPRTSM